jgi:hypothetical protein
MSLLDALFGVQKIFADGVLMLARGAINFKGPGVTVTDNPLTGAIDVEIDGGGTGEGLAPTNTPNVVAGWGAAGTRADLPFARGSRRVFDVSQYGGATWGNGTVDDRPAIVAATTAAIRLIGFETLVFGDDTYRAGAEVYFPIPPVRYRINTGSSGQPIRIVNCKGLRWKTEGNQSVTLAYGATDNGVILELDGAEGFVAEGFQFDRQVTPRPSRAVRIIPPTTPNQYVNRATFRSCRFGAGGSQFTTSIEVQDGYALFEECAIGGYDSRGVLITGNAHVDFVRSNMAGNGSSAADKIGIQCNGASFSWDGAAAGGGLNSITTTAPNACDIWIGPLMHTRPILIRGLNSEHSSEAVRVGDPDNPSDEVGPPIVLDSNRFEASDSLRPDGRLFRWFNRTMPIFMGGTNSGTTSVLSSASTTADRTSSAARVPHDGVILLSVGWTSTIAGAWRIETTTDPDGLTGWAHDTSLDDAFTIQPDGTNPIAAAPVHLDVTGVWWRLVFARTGGTGSTLASIDGGTLLTNASGAGNRQSPAVKTLTEGKAKLRVTWANPLVGAWRIAYSADGLTGWAHAPAHDASFTVQQDGTNARDLYVELIGIAANFWRLEWVPSSGTGNVSSSLYGGRGGLPPRLFFGGLGNDFHVLWFGVIGGAAGSEDYWNTLVPTQTTWGTKLFGCLEYVDTLPSIPSVSGVIYAPQRDGGVRERLPMPEAICLQGTGIGTIGAVCSNDTLVSGNISSGQEWTSSFTAIGGVTELSDKFALVVSHMVVSGSPPDDLQPFVKAFGTNTVTVRTKVPITGGTVKYVLRFKRTGV